MSRVIISSAKTAIHACWPSHVPKGKVCHEKSANSDRGVATSAAILIQTHRPPQVPSGKVCSKKAINMYHVKRFCVVCCNSKRSSPAGACAEQRGELRYALFLWWVSSWELVSEETVHCSQGRLYQCRIRGVYTLLSQLHNREPIKYIDIWYHFSWIGLYYDEQYHI